MKIEVRCGACRRGFLVDERDAGGSMGCPACLAPIELGGTPERTEAAAPPVVASAEPAEVAGTTKAAVVCPRCKLHFDPDSKLARDHATSVDQRPRVLVLEDLEYFRQVATDALSGRYEVVLASDAVEAGIALAEAPVQLIVVDLDLEGGSDGRDFLRDLQPKPCPILVFTAQDESEMYGERWDELQQLGADDLVIKGMRVAESLQRKVDAMLGAPPDEI